MDVCMAEGMALGWMFGVMLAFDGNCLSILCSTLLYSTLSNANPPQPSKQTPHPPPQNDRKTP